MDRMKEGSIHMERNKEVINQCHLYIKHSYKPLFFCSCVSITSSCQWVGKGGSDLHISKNKKWQFPISKNKKFLKIHFHFQKLPQFPNSQNKKGKFPISKNKKIVFSHFPKQPFPPTYNNFIYEKSQLHQLVQRRLLVQLRLWAEIYSF